MALKNMFTKINEKFTRYYEFQVDLEDHEVENQNIYRLHFINYHRIDEYDGNKDNNIGVIDWPCKPFELPNGMSREDAFKVLSYLTDFIEERNDIEPCSLKSVLTLDKAIDLERFGFSRVEESDDSKVLDLFTVTGRLLLFKRSELYKKYFNWYKEGVTLEEVHSIYDKLSMNFENIHWVDEQEVNEYSR